MVFRSTPLDSSRSDRHYAWSPESASPSENPSESNGLLLAEWLEPDLKARASVEAGAQGSGARLEGTALPREAQEGSKGRGFEIVNAEDEMTEAMEAFCDGIILLAQLLSPPQVEQLRPGQNPVAPLRPEMGQVRPEDLIGPLDLGQPTPIWKKVSDLFRSLPANTQCTPERFPEMFGQDVAALLNQMSVQRISHWTTPDGKHHYSLELPEKKTHVFKTAEMTHEPVVQFEVVVEPDGIRLEEFRGLKVKKADGTFTATIDSVAIKPVGENVIIDGKGHWFFFRGSKTLVLGPDGKPVPDKAEAKAKQ